MDTIGSAVADLIISKTTPSKEVMDALITPPVKTSFIVYDMESRDANINTKYTEDKVIMSYSDSFIGTVETTSEISTFDRLINTLDSYKVLEEDWDGYGGVSPSNEEVDTAIDLIFKIKRDNLPTPKPMLSGSGNVGLYWDGKDSYIELGIEGDKSYYTYISEGDKYAGQENNMLDKPLPDTLIHALENLSD